MPLITTAAQLRQYCPGITYTSQSALTLPNMDIADEQYIIPILGQTLYNTIIAVSTNADILRLKELCMRAVAPLAIMNGLATKQLQISDMGVHSSVSDTTTPATRWAYYELKESLANAGAEALEKVWLQLINNANTYEWTNPLPYKTVFSGGDDFSKFFNVPKPYITFSALAPIISEVQDANIYNNFGESFINALIAKTTPNANELIAIRLIKAAVANLTINSACSKLSARVTEKGFTVLMGDGGDMPFKGQNDSSYTLKQDLKNVTARDGMRYLSELKNYLDTNAGTELFADYYASSYYTAPSTTVKENPNKNRRGVFAL